MTNNRLKLAIPLSALLLLSSCRTEEFLQEIEQKEEISKKFITFTKKYENDVIDYGEGFKYLALRYDSIHKTNITGKANIEAFKKKLQSNKKEMPLSEREKISYIDFNIRSQLIEEENGDKWMIFPEVKGKKVVNLVAAVLSKEETLLGYHYINKETNFYKENIGLFQERYNKRFLGGKDPLLATVKRWYDEGRYTNIEEITIIVRDKHSRDGLGQLIYRNPEGGDWEQIPYPDLDCGFYQSCLRDMPGDNGNGFFYPDQLNSDPCAQMKAKNRSPLYQQKVNELNKHSVLSDRREHGYVEDRNGKFTELKPGKSTANSDSMTMPMEGIRGYVHTHQDEYETGKVNDEGEPEIRKSIKMFSPRDVGAVMDIASLRADGDYADIYGTMIASNGVYTIRFTGTKNDIKTGFSGKEWNDRYIDFMNIQGGSIETKFLRFMKEKMGVSGISLFKTEKNGTIKKYELNNKNKAEKSDCN